MSKKVLILGSGFSKAACSSMPTVEGISHHLQHLSESNEELIELQEQIYQRFLTRPDQFELLLTYLSQEQPWDSQPERYQKLALFTRISEYLGEYLSHCEDNLLKTRMPKWLPKLVGYLDDQHLCSLKTSSCESIPIITFNYDTIVERALLKACSTRMGNEITSIDSVIYRAYLQWLNVFKVNYSTISTVRNDLPDFRRTFHLIKLHGSINWFYPGPNNPNQIIFGVQVESRVSPNDSYTQSCETASGMVPLIIPPILDKTPFYNHYLIRKFWNDAKLNLEHSDQIYCIGYSMPLTDLTSRLLFQTLSNQPKKTVYLINLKTDDAQDKMLLDRYKTSFPNQEINQDYFLPVEKNPIERFVGELVGF